MSKTEIRHDWSLDEIQALFAMPFNDLFIQRSRFTANISIRMRSKSALCSRLKPARAPKIAVTALKVQSMTLS